MVSLVVEDGSGLSNANSYLTIAEADEYLDRYAVSTIAWTSLSDANKSRYLIQATATLDGTYLLRFKGSKANWEQSLQWPRMEVLDASDFEIETDVIPLQVKYAVAELAYRLSAGTSIRPDLDRGGRIKSEQVDTLRTEYFNDANSQTVFTIVEDLLKDFLYASNRLVRG